MTEPRPEEDRPFVAEEWTEADTRDLWRMLRAARRKREKRERAGDDQRTGPENPPATKK